MDEGSGDFGAWGSVLLSLRKRCEFFVRDRQDFVRASFLIINLCERSYYDYFEEKNSFFLLFENRFLRLRSFLRDSIDLFDERLRTRNILL